MPQREAILSIVAQIAPDKVDAVASLIPQAAPTRRRKSGVLVRYERDEALVEEWRRQQALKAAVRELERRELQQRESGRVTIFVYDERIKFRRIPAPTQRHPVPSILSGRVRAGKARIVKYIIELDEANNLRVFDWSALLKQHRI
jgi:quinol monooxygenase YgiN